MEHFGPMCQLEWGFYLHPYTLTPRLHPFPPSPPGPATTYATKFTDVSMAVLEQKGGVLVSHQRVARPSALFQWLQMGLKEA
jgi:hypothetical protein